MTAVLSAMDPLRTDRHLSLDDNVVNYSNNTDWRAKYDEAIEMLDSTRAELDDFYQASKEVEAELESEIQRNEKVQQELRAKVARTETERDNWKSKFMSLQTTYNTTTTQLQRELDKLRQEFQRNRVQLRELEMGNDDLERSERAVSSSLADMEAKYSRVLEEKILLEQELLEKAKMEENMQRLRDELKDANIEILVLKDQIIALSTSTRVESSSPRPPLNLQVDSLLSEAPPRDLQSSDLSPDMQASADSEPRVSESILMTPKASRISPPTRSGLPKAMMTPTRITRSATAPTFGRSPTVPVLKLTTRTISTTSNVSVATASSASTSRSKGVQMVSEMRAKVKNLEQKIHTRVPRLRMGNLARPSTNPALTTSAIPQSSSSITTARPFQKSAWDGFSLGQRRSADARRSADVEKDKGKHPGDMSGWVLIMEDSPSPKPKGIGVERRPTSSPTAAPTSFRPVPLTSAMNASKAAQQLSSLAQGPVSGLRRPSSRLSGGSFSTTTTSSISTPTSRPATPTFVPSPNSFHSSTSIAVPKQPAGVKSVQAKRSSFGANVSSMSPPDRLPVRPVTNTPLSSSRYGDNTGRGLPQLPSLTSTMRSVSKPTISTSHSLVQSRIGRPNSTGTSAGRKSAGDSDKEWRPRAESSTAVYEKDYF